ncbi:uroplakin-3b [Clarias gariepinus]
MKAFLVVCLVCIKFHGIFAATFVNITPSIPPNLVVPVTTNNVYLQKPFCYFDNVTCGAQGPCIVWLAAALSSAIGTFDIDKTNPNLISLTSYPTTFNSDQKNYFVTQVGSQNNLHCTNSGIPPTYFQVGASGACTVANCNGLLPSGQTMSFKYFLANSSNSLIAESNWSNNITLNTLKGPASLGSGYAGRSAAMVVITSILCVAAALLLFLLLAFLIMACCCHKGKTQTYNTRRQPSLIGSLRIPSYDVHNLKNPSPYDNTAYEHELRKKRYTTNSTLPQTTTTIITTVQSDTPDNITIQKM